MPSRARAARFVVLLLVLGALGACKKQERKNVDDIPGESSSSGDGVGGGDTNPTTGGVGGGDTNPTTGGVGGGPSADLTAACEAFCAKATELGCGEGCTFGCSLLSGSCAEENIAFYDCARTTDGYMSCGGQGVVVFDVGNGCEAESQALGDCI